jgi:hypothetical protein
MTAVHCKIPVQKNCKLILPIIIFVGSILFVLPSLADNNSLQASIASNWHARNGLRLQRNWGVDVVGVRPVANGMMLSFRYKVLDAAKAKVLNDKRSKAYIIDEATGNVLGVPIMEKLGEMRQKADPEIDRTYFIMFGNPGKLVKSGSFVGVVIGEFRIEKLMVD